MRFRKLRIAWSVVWGFACVLLIALWARSYRGESFISLQGHWIVSFYGEILVDVWERNSLGDGWQDMGKGFRVPYWLPVSITLVSALVSFPWTPWLRYRFSLRTLLIATTLVAVVLGLVVYAVRN